jgi:hypothetical protein
MLPTIEITNKLKKEDYRNIITSIKKRFKILQEYPNNIFGLINLIKYINNYLIANCVEGFIKHTYLECIFDYNDIKNDMECYYLERLNSFYIYKIKNGGIYPSKSNYNVNINDKSIDENYKRFLLSSTVNDVINTITDQHKLMICGEINTEIKKEILNLFTNETSDEKTNEKTNETKSNLVGVLIDYCCNKSEDYISNVTLNKRRMKVPARASDPECISFTNHIENNCERLLEFQEKIKFYKSDSIIENPKNYSKYDNIYIKLCKNYNIDDVNKLKKCLEDNDYLDYIYSGRKTNFNNFYNCYLEYLMDDLKYYKLYCTINNKNDLIVNDAKINQLTESIKTIQLEKIKKITKLGITIDESIIININNFKNDVINDIINSINNDEKIRFEEDKEKIELLKEYVDKLVIKKITISETNTEIDKIKEIYENVFIDEYIVIIKTIYTKLFEIKCSAEIEKEILNFCGNIFNLNDVINIKEKFNNLYNKIIIIFQNGFKESKSEYNDYILPIYDIFKDSSETKETLDIYKDFLNLNLLILNAYNNKKNPKESLIMKIPMKNFWYLITTSKLNSVGESTVRDFSKNVDYILSYNELTKYFANEKYNPFLQN